MSYQKHIDEIKQYLNELERCESNHGQYNLTLGLMDELKELVMYIIENEAVVNEKPKKIYGDVSEKELALIEGTALFNDAEIQIKQSFKDIINTVDIIGETDYQREQQIFDEKPEEMLQTIQQLLEIANNPSMGTYERWLAAYVLSEIYVEYSGDEDLNVKSKDLGMELGDISLTVFRNLRDDLAVNVPDWKLSGDYSTYRDKDGELVIYYSEQNLKFKQDRYDLLAKTPIGKAASDYLYSTSCEAPEPETPEVKENPVDTEIEHKGIIRIWVNDDVHVQKNGSLDSTDVSEIRDKLNANTNIEWHASSHPLNGINVNDGGLAGSRTIYTIHNIADVTEIIRNSGLTLLQGDITPNAWDDHVYFTGFIAAEFERLSSDQQQGLFNALNSTYLDADTKQSKDTPQSKLPEFKENFEAATPRTITPSNPSPSSDLNHRQ